MIPELRAVQRALDRLERSDTPRKRKNARQAFDRALRQIGRLKDSYPALRKDGTVIEPRKRKGVFCPYRKIPVPSHMALARWMSENGKADLFVCPCGCECKNTRGLAQHLRLQDDLIEHLAVARMAEIASG